MLLTPAIRATVVYADVVVGTVPHRMRRNVAAILTVPIRMTEPPMNGNVIGPTMKQGAYLSMQVRLSHVVLLMY